MRVIYACYGGAHSSPVAAALHLGRLARDRVPSADELMQLDLYDKTTKEQHGDLMQLGTDRWKNDIYVLGRGPSGRSMERAVLSGMRLAGAKGDDVKFVNTLVTVNMWMRIGGFLSRAVKLVRIGRPLVIYGTRKAFPDLVRVVEQVEQELARLSTAEMGAVAGKHIQRDRESQRSPGDKGRHPAP